MSDGATPQRRGGPDGAVAPACGWLRLSLLDGFRLTCGGRPVRVELSSQRVLAFLAVHDRDVARQQVAGVLWPSASDKRASGSLRSALWRLRAQGLGLVRAVDDLLGIEPGVEVDLRRAADAARRLQSGADELCTVDLEDLPFTGDLLPGWYDDWLLLERERQRQIRLHGLEALCERLTERGSLARAVLAGLAAVSEEPLRESAHRALIRAHLAEGNPGEAVRQFRAYADLLEREMQRRPSPVNTGLVAHLLAGAPA